MRRSMRCCAASGRGSSRVRATGRRDASAISSGAGQACGLLQELDALPVRGDEGAPRARDCRDRRRARAGTRRSPSRSPRGCARARRGFRGRGRTSRVLLPCTSPARARRASPARSTGGRRDHHDRCGARRTRNQVTADEMATSSNRGGELVARAATAAARAARAAPSIGGQRSRRRLDAPGQVADVRPRGRSRRRVVVLSSIQCLPQETARPEELRLRCAFRDAGHFRDLGMAVALDVVQHEHRARAPGGRCAIAASRSILAPGRPWSRAPRAVPAPPPR